jgi:class 3 adenylate cyclase
VNLGEHPEAVDPMYVVERNLATRPLIDQLLEVVSQLYRYHSRLTFREDGVAAGTFAEVRSMTVGFVDLASSTEIGSHLPAAELASAINDFNAAAWDLAAREGARIVKTIGDEAMIVGLGAREVARCAAGLVGYFSDHAVFHAARAGIASGDVLELDGDCHGPVVNRAARFVAAAPDGTVTADAATVDALADCGFAADELPAQEHRGLGRLPWYRLTPDPAGPT